MYNKKRVSFSQFKLQSTKIYILYAPGVANLIFIGFVVIFMLFYFLFMIFM